MGNLTIEELAKNSEISYESVLASGPGGQNINKNATAVKLYFNINTSSLSRRVKQKLFSIAGKNVSKDGTLVITAKRYKSKPQNKKDAKERLLNIIEKASYRKKYRVATKPTKGSKKRRFETKKKKSQHKKMRKKVDINHEYLT